MADEDLSSIPDRKLTLMGQQQDTESSIDSSALINETILLKNEEIERLVEQLAQEKAKHEETRK